MKKFRFLFVLLTVLMGLQSVMAQNYYTIENTSWEAAYYKSNQCQTPPPSDWYMPDFNDSSWGIITGPLTTNFQDRDAFWCRQWIELSQDQIVNDLLLRIAHDDEAMVYVNGNLVYDYQGATSSNSQWISSSCFHEGMNLIAVYCYDSGSGQQYLDFRISTGYNTEVSLEGMPFVKSDIPTFHINKTACTLYVTDQEKYSTAYLNTIMLTPDGICNNPVTWTSSDPSVASVSDGKVVALSGGNTTITAQVTYDGTTYTQSCDVKVISFAAGEKVIFMPEAGRLSEFLTQTEIEDLTKLTIFGDLNGTDVRILRAMAGRDYNNNATGYSLQELDLTNANFVSGGESYNKDNHYTYEGEIGYSMFRGCTALRKVCLPRGTRRISGEAFFGCNHLKEVVFPEDGQLTSIDWGAFYNTGLVRVEIPASLTDISNSIFSECYQLEEVVFPDNCKLGRIGDSMFCSCSKLSTINIPSSIKTIENSAFSSTGLTSVTFAAESKLESIGITAFSSTQLESITLPETCLSISNGAFQSNQKLREVNLPKKLRALSEYIFHYCTALTTFTVPTGIRVVGNRAFSDCYNLTTVTFPEGTQVREMGEDVFYSCNNLMNIMMMAAEPPMIEENTFNGQNATIYVPADAMDTYKAAPVWRNYDLKPLSGEISITMTETSVAVMGGVINEGVDKHQLNYAVFNPFSKEQGAVTWSSADNSIATVDENGLVKAAGNGTTTITLSIVFGDKTYTAECQVESQMFESASPIIYIKDPGTLEYIFTDEQKQSLTEIKVIGNPNSNDIYQLRQMCSSKLESIDLSEVKMEYMDSQTFREATNLKHILLPKNLKQIEDYMFYGDAKLESVIIPDSVTNIGGYAFDGCVSLTEINIPALVDNYGNEPFDNSGIKTFNISEDNHNFIFDSGILYYKDGQVVYWSSEITGTFTFPEFMTAVPDWFFTRGANSITNVIIGENITRIGYRAFDGLNQDILQSIAIKNPQPVEVDWETVYQLRSDAFPVIVPFGSVEAYKNTNWNYFNMLMETVKETTFRINQTEVTLYQTTNEETGQAQLTVFAATPTAFLTPVVQWRSLNENVAVVTEDGKVIMTGAGTTSIVASTTIEGQEYTSQVTVNCFAPSEGEMFVYVKEAGTLENLIPSSQLSSITNLALFGQINGDDVRIIREMAGRDMDNQECQGSLRRLDLSQVNIVYGGQFRTLWDSYQYTNDNQLCWAMFAECYTLEEVILPNNITNTSDCVFYRCLNLKKVVLPKNLNSLGHQMFYECNNLESIVIPASVESTYHSFQSCEKLAEVTFEQGSRLSNIGDRTFENCRALTSITIPATVTSISAYAFENSGLQNITIPENSQINSIGTNAFNGTYLTSFYVPEKIRSITAARINNAQLTTITVHPDNANYFAQDGVLYSKRDNSIAMMPMGKSGVFRTPDFMTTITAGAFNGCERLNSIVLSTNIASIADNAFGDCRSLNGLFVLNPTVVTATANAFNGLDKVLTTVFVPVGTLEAYQATDWNVFENIYEFTANPQLWMASSDVTLYDTQIEGTRKRQLEAMIVSAEGPADADVAWSVADPAVAKVSEDGIVEVVGGGKTVVTASATYGGENLTAQCNVTVVAGGDGIDLLYVERAGTVNELLSTEDRQRITDLVVLGNVNSEDLRVIGDMARSYGGQLTTLDLSQVNLVDKSIGYECFNNNTSLREVKLPENLTYIDNYAFRNTNLEEVVIPESVTSIRYYAFGDCNNLKTITVSDNIEFDSAPWGWSASDYLLTLNVRFTDVAKDLGTIFDGIDTRTTINYLVDGNPMTEYIIPDGTKRIGARRFYGCQSIQNMTVPASVETIGERALEGIMEVHFLGTTPATLTSSEGFSSDAVYVVPSAALSKYRSAVYWSDFKNQIIPDDAVLALDLTVSAENDRSAVVVKAGGEDKVEYLTRLTLHGTINSYDIFAIRTKMPNLHVLDLTDVEIVANPYEYYTGSHTEDHRLGSNAFIDMTKLVEIHLPKHITEIGDRAFAGCTNLRILEMHEGIETIGGSAFVANRSMKRFDLPNGIKSVGMYAFSGCSNLEEINFGEGLLSMGDYLCYPYWEEGRDWYGELNKLHTVRIPNTVKEIGWDAFSYCRSLKNIVLPTGLQRIRGYAFRDCNSLTELRLPPMLEYIEDYAFQGCNNIKDVYTYVVVPKDIAINQNTFTLECYDKAMLHVPDFSRYAYMWNTQWGQFAGMTEFTDTYDTFYAKNTLKLDDETGAIQGTPDANIHETGGIEIEGDVSQELGDVDLNHNGTDGGSIITENGDNISIKHLNVKISVEAGQWYFFCFPFDVPLADVKYGGEYVWRQYDGAARSRRENGWKDLEEGTEKLIAGRGYIFQGTSSSVLHLNIHNPEIRYGDSSTDLETYVGASTQPYDANWNFVGNPYTSYYSVDEDTYSSPITIWTGHGYEAYRPGDDDYEFAPYQAFFVQSGNGNNSVNFSAGNRGTKDESDAKKNQKMARRAKKFINPDRVLVNLQISVPGEETYMDKTRVVFNDNKSHEYESDCDAAKFFSDERKAEIYTVGKDGVKYSINERPEDDAVVTMGLVANVEGTYSIAAQRMDTPMMLKDNMLNLTHDLSLGEYEFTSVKGTFDNRFTLVKRQDVATTINQLAQKLGINVGVNGNDISIEGLADDTHVSVYTTAGQCLGTMTGNGSITVQPGVHIITIGHLSAKIPVK